MVGFDKDLKALRSFVADQRRRSVPAVPDDLKTFIEDFCVHPHKDTGEPVRGELNAAQLLWLEERTTFRISAEGYLEAASDVIFKARQLYCTTLIADAIGWALLKWPNQKAETYLHSDGAGDLLRGLRENVLYMYLHFPPWADVVSPPGAPTIRLSNGGRHTIGLAGQSEQHAEGKGRSGAKHIVHFSECAFYAHPQNTVSAAMKSLSDVTGQCIAESTPSTRDSWHAHSYRSARDGVGEFDRAFFLPWFLQGSKRIKVGSRRFERVMGPAFSAGISQTEIDQEERLRSTHGLDIEQIAWRRREFFAAGSDALTRAKNRRENPEDDESCYADSLQSFVDPRALDIADAMSREHRLHLRFTPSLQGWLYSLPEPGRAVVVGEDQAGRKSKTDWSTSVFIDQTSWDVLATIRGKATAEEHDAATRAMANALGLQRGRWVTVPDITQDFGLVDQHNAKKTPIWKRKKSRSAGVRVGARIRNAIINSVAYAVEGPTDPKHPVCDLPCRRLNAELRGWHDNGERIDHPEGGNDDLAMAFGLAIYGAKRWKPRRRVMSGATTVGAVGHREPRRGGGSGLR
jgi:hypothetical protein